MPKLKDQQDADRQYDPYSNENARDLLRQDNEAGVNAGIDQAEAFANDPKNASQDNTDKVRSLEETPNEFGFTPSEKKQSPRKTTFKGILRSRKTASGGIIGLLIALLGGMSLFITPGLAAVQMKEILTDDLNDQLGAMDLRSTYVMRAKLNDLGKGVCTGVKIRCGFKGMSDRQLKKFTAAGFDVKTEGKVFGRNHVTSLSITDSTGNRITANNPREFNRMLGDRIIQNSFRKAFNPKFAGFFDAKWDSFKQRYNLTSKDKLGTGSEEEKRSNVTSAAEGDPISVDGADRVPTTDEDGKPVDGSDNTNSAVDRANDAVTGGGVPTKSILGSAGKGAIKGIGILGAADTACTVKNTARAVEAGAKLYRYRQLIAYSMVFLTFADSIKAGTATPDQAEFVGNTLTAVDTDKMIVDENSTNDGDSVTEVENPYYGANAFDSAGYKVAMYNEAPTLSARDMQMAIGGGVSLSMLSKINGFIDKYGGGNCKAIQNWAVRGGSIVVGIAAGIITFGGATLASIGASVAISMAVPVLENYLAQMMAGTVANGDTKGVDTGNAIFAGTAALMGGMAMSRGMKPATKSDLKSYLALNEEVKADYVAMETGEANKTPFDVGNRYSFMGSLVRTLMPLKTTSSVSIGNSFLNGVGYILSAPLSSSIAHAKNAYNEDRYSKCEDNGYEELGIDADVFCNVRYAMSPYELGLDTEEVRAQMLEWGQVNDDEDGSVVTDSDYDHWLTECTEREQGWGETEAENQEDGDGTRCMGTEKRDSYYRVYTMDASIIAAMDYTPPTGTGSFTSGGSQFRIASYNILGKSHTEGDSWIGRADKVINNIKTNTIDVIGFQEYEDAQRGYISKALPNYGITTHGKLADGIMWNNDKFSLVNKGTWQTTYFTKGNDEPWIKLKDNETQQEFYVMNVHDPINRGTGNAETRAENARKHLELIKKLQVEAPVLLTGDFNNGYEKSDGAGMNSNEDTAYCILSSSGLMVHTYDALSDRKFQCPNPLPASASIQTNIDHIYLSTGMDATQFFDIEKDAAGSDHAAVVADVIIPSVGTGTGAGTEFIIGSYNQKRALSLGQHQGAAKNIVDSQMDIVGTQESTNPKYDRYRTYLGDKNYGVYPAQVKGSPNQTCSYAQSIFYNKAKFKLIKGEYFEIPRYPEATQDCGGGERTTNSHNEVGLPEVWTHVPIVWLEDVDTGQQLIVMNTHNVANVAGAAGTKPSKSRYVSAKIYVEQVTRLKSQNPNIPIVFTGDFNEGTNVRADHNVTLDGKQSNLLFCMFAENGLMKSAFGPAMRCDPSYSSGGVDYIYATPEVKVEWTKEFASGGSNSGPPSFSDHPVRYAKLVVPGTGGVKSADGWVWPIKESESKSGPCYGGPRIHAGMDINSNQNSTVLAMHDGTVEQIGSGGDAGNYLMVKTKEGIFYAYEHLVTGSIEVKRGDWVTAGTPVAKMGKTGNVDLDSSVAHLHVVTSKTATLGSYGNLGDTFDPLRVLLKVKPGNYTCTKN